MNKKEFGILRAYVVPHPPVVLPEIGRGREEEIAATGKAMRQVAREIAELAPDTIILSSPIREQIDTTTAALCRCTSSLKNIRISNSCAWVYPDSQARRIIGSVRLSPQRLKN